MKNQKNIMNRRKFLATTGMVGATALTTRRNAFSMGKSSQKKSLEKKPNLLFIFTDEHPAKGWSRGISLLKTPNLERLASEGVTVTNCISNNPICVPYRATLFTGLYGHQNGFVNNHDKFPLNGDLPSWSKTLKRSGYTMGYVGKWHLYPGCEDPLWENGKRRPYRDKETYQVLNNIHPGEFNWTKGVSPDYDIKEPANITPAKLRHGFDDLWIQSSNHNRPRNTYVWDKDGKYKKIDDYAPTFLTDRFIEFIDENKNSEKPFCGVLSLLPPHPSYPGAKKKWVDYYNSIETPFWGNVPEKHRTKKHMRDLKNFYAHISSVDEEVGKILDKLDEIGLSDNTIVIFTTDHGDLHYAHGVKWKRYPFEESIRVPFIAKYPGKLPAGKTDDLLLGAIDIAPTLLGLTGHSDRIPETMQGMDLSSRLCTGKGEEPDSQFILYNLPESTHYIIKKQPRLMDYRGIRTKRWTYTLQKDPDTGKISPWHLFDNKADPLQMNNLCDDPKYSDLCKKFRKKIEEYLQFVGEPEWLEDKPRDRSKIPGTYKRKEN